MKQASLKTAVQRGSTFGLVYLILLIPTTILSFINFNLSLNIVNASLATICNICFILLLCGVLAIATEKGQTALSQYAKLDIAFTIPLMVFNILLAFFYWVNALFIPLLIFQILINIAIGVLNIRLAKSFLPLEGEYGKYAKNAAEWSKVAGWFVAIPITSPVGYIILLIGEYNVWRIVKKRAEQY